MRSPWPGSPTAPSGPDFPTKPTPLASSSLSPPRPPLLCPCSPLHLLHCFPECEVATAVPPLPGVPAPSLGLAQGACQQAPPPSRPLPAALRYLLSPCCMLTTLSSMPGVSDAAMGSTGVSLCPEAHCSKGTGECQITTEGSPQRQRPRGARLSLCAGAAWAVSAAAPKNGRPDLRTGG